MVHNAITVLTFFFLSSQVQIPSPLQNKGASCCCQPVHAGTQALAKQPDTKNETTDDLKGSQATALPSARRSLASHHHFGTGPWDPVLTNCSAFSSCSVSCFYLFAQTTYFAFYAFCIGKCRNVLFMET